MNKIFIIMTKYDTICSFDFYQWVITSENKNKLLVW